MAEGEDYGTRLARFWAPNRFALLWLVLSLAPLFFFQTFVHEGLHWLTTVAEGGDPTLIPFAHFNENPFGGGQNRNGATEDPLGFIAMPQVVCLVLLVVLIVVFVATSPPWWWLRTFLTWWYAGIALDLLANTYGALVGQPPGGTDWAVFAAQSGLGTARALSWTILLVILSQLAWIRFSRWHVNRPQARGFREFRGFAVFLAIVSAIAVVVSHTIDHPDIVRNGFFWLCWIWQLLSLVGFLVYLAWATKRA